MKESVKTIVLIILFSIAMILTGLLLIDKNAYFKAKIVETVEISAETNAIEYLKPFNYEVNFSGESFTVVYDDKIERTNIWDTSREALGRYFEFGDIEVIQWDKWEEQKSYKSLKLNFELTFELADFTEVLIGAREREWAINDVQFDSIIIPARETQVIFIGDEDSGKYYGIKEMPKQMNEIAEIIDSVKKTEYIDYKESTNYFLLEEDDMDYNEKSVQIPIVANGLVELVNVRKELDVTSNESGTAAKSFAGKMFGENLEFVKKYTQNDKAILYMHGYGDRSYKFNVDGSIEFWDKREDKVTRKVSFGEGLKIALGEIEKMGEIPESLYLKSHEHYLQNNEEVRKYTFGYKIKGLPVFAKEKNKALLEVELRSGNVYRVYKDIKIYKNAYEGKEVIIFNEMLSDANMTEFTNNYIAYLDQSIDASVGGIDEVFKNGLMDYLKYDYTDDTEVWVQKLIKQIRNLNLRYYFIDNENSKLVPVWTFDLGSTKYVIDAHDSVILKKMKVDGGAY